eukprot:gene8968-10518_t
MILTKRVLLLTLILTSCCLSVVLSKNEAIIAVWDDENTIAYMGSYPYEVTGPAGYKLEGELVREGIVPTAIGDAEGEYCVQYKMSKYVPGRYGKKDNKICFTMPTSDGKPFNATISVTSVSTPTDFIVTLYDNPEAKISPPWNEVPEEVEVSLVNQKTGEVYETVKTKGVAEFKDQPKGLYCIEVKLPDSLKGQDGGKCFDKVPGPSDEVQELLVGLTKADEIYIKGFAWLDNNYNGIKEEGEDYAGPYEATLLKDEKEVAPIRIEPKVDGFRHKVKAGNYCMAVVDPEGVTTPTKLGKDNFFLPDTSLHCFIMPPKDAKPNSEGVIEYEIKAGFTKTYDVTGHVWLDVNGDDEEDEGDERLVAHVEIYTPSLSGTPIQKFETEEDGSFFAGLIPPGNYCIAITAEGKAPVKPSDEFSHINAEGIKCFTLPTEDGAELEIKAGLKKQGIKVPIFVWTDDSFDGEYSERFSDRPYKEDILIVDEDGVTVKEVKGADGRPSATVELEPGRYCVKIKNPDWVRTVMGKDNDNEDGCFEVKKDVPEPKEVVIGYRRKLSATIFEDLNHDGKRDEATEKMLKGIKITLKDRSSGEVIDNKETGENGEAKFENLEPKNLCFKAVDPSGKMIVTVDGANNDLDKNGETCFRLPASFGINVKVITHVDVWGGFENSLSISITNFEDINKNGADDDKKFYGPMRGTLTKDDEKPPKVIKTFTIPSSRTGFKVRDLAPGKYSLKITDPKNKYKPTSLGKDNKVDPANNTYKFDLSGSSVDKFGDMKIKGGWIKR